MYPRTTNIFFLMLLIFLAAQHCSAQAQLVQTFIEINNMGDTQFGCSVSSAGDVNNDGYNDVIVGATGYGYSTGRAYIFYGGNPMNNTVDVTMTGEGSNNYFGYSVSSAGDVNNDGYDDVIIGAYGSNSYSGRAYIYFGGSPMDSTVDVNMTGGDQSREHFGCSVSGAGDVNNDGYDDVIVGASHYNYSFVGRAYIFCGGSTMDNIADVTMTGEGTLSRFGWSVSGVGDVNNDGFDDVAIGADWYNSVTGRVYIYYGGSQMDSTTDVTMTGEYINNYFGSSVSRAGDVNNDGYADVIVGAYGYSSETGRTYIYYGGNQMDSTADVTITGKTTSDQFGYSISGAGDVNNDGYDDVIVGATGYGGRVYIYFGGSAMDSTIDITMTSAVILNLSGYGCSVSGAGDVNNDGYADVIVGANYFNIYTGQTYIYYGSNIKDSIVDVTMTGEGTGNEFGNSVSGAGDVNNDGYADVIIGAYRFNDAVGRIYIYYGGNPMDSIADVLITGNMPYEFFGYSVSSAGDVNNDGYDDVIVGSSMEDHAYLFYGGNPMDSIADVMMTGEGTMNYFGCSVSGGGDVNNDGYDDVIVGAIAYNSNTGRAYIYYGGNPINSIADVTMTGEGTNNYFGRSVSGAGDVNNDGYDDVIIGADGYNRNPGRVYIYYGGSQMDSIADVKMIDQEVHDLFGYSVSGAGDVNNDGFADVVVGLYRFNSFTGRVYIYFGSSLMDSIADVTISGKVINDCFGYSVADAGDVNNDGYDDIIIGANNQNTFDGPVYIYYGGSQMDSIADVTITSERIGINFGYSVSGAGDVNKDGYDEVIIGANWYPVNGKAYIYNAKNSQVSVQTMTYLNPDKFEFLQNFPNPFNPSTIIEFRLARDGKTTLKIYDILGREVATLVDKEMKSGVLHQVRFDASKLSSGIYFSCLESNGKKQVRKLMLMK